MKTKDVSVLAALVVLSTFLPAGTGLAQNQDHSWSKTYPVAGKPSLMLETGDASVDFHSCGDCREIRIRIDVADRKLSDYRLEESQNGDQVHFLFKRLPLLGSHFWQTERTRVTVESPVQLTLQAKTADGNVNLSGLQGELSFTTDDGSVTLDHVSGNLRIRSSDGQVKITDAQGSIDAHTSDGGLSVDGSFHALALHTSDGTTNLNLREGTKLAEAATIQSSDGPVIVRVAQNFAADLNVHTSDGHVECALPLTTDHYESGRGEGHDLRGKLNGGGATLTIHTSDGNVKIESL